MELSKIIVVIFFCIVTTLGGSMAANYEDEWRTKKSQVGETRVFKYDPPSSDHSWSFHGNKDAYKYNEASSPIAIAPYNGRKDSVDYSSEGDHYFTSRKDHKDHKHDKCHNGASTNLASKSLISTIFGLAFILVILLHLP
ncbi:uncharacterized protein [Coffea arabica]|uniref:Uncharacterized protein n=1 Tax=Coffea arabica TaxID=13443 RepID=A0ABM4UZE6_COFAR